MTSNDQPTNGGGGAAPPSSAPKQIAVISDIHGNVQALRAVLQSIEERGIPTIICLGDVVGYGANPNECIDLLKERDIPTIAGNHDHAAVGMVDITFFNEIAKKAVHWTREVLTEENAAWLKERPYTHELAPDYFFVHASPVDPPAWSYVLTFGEARNCFDAFGNPFCFIGHSHQPAIVEKSGRDLSCPEGYSVAVKEKCRYLVNVGSVGQPRDRNPAACYVHADLETNQIHFVRVPYDIQSAQEAILTNKLPEELAERLGYGW